MIHTLTTLTRSDTIRFWVEAHRLCTVIVKSIVIINTRTVSYIKSLPPPSLSIHSYDEYIHIYILHSYYDSTCLPNPKLKPSNTR